MESLEKQQKSSNFQKKLQVKKNIVKKKLRKKSSIQNHKLPVKSTSSNTNSESNTSKMPAEVILSRNSSIETTQSQTTQNTTLTNTPHTNHSTTCSPENIIQPNTDLIDVDLIRGSTFSKAKNKLSVGEIVCQCSQYYFLYPLYFKFWISQVNYSGYFYFLCLYICQIFNWWYYLYRSKNDKFTGCRCQNCLMQKITYKVAAPSKNFTSTSSLPVLRKSQNFNIWSDFFYFSTKRTSDLSVTYFSNKIGKNVRKSHKF